MANELPCPTEQLSRQYYLPSKRKSKFICKKTAGNPANETEEGSQTTRFRIQTDIKQRIDQSKQKPKIQEKDKIVLEQGQPEVEQRWRKVRDNESCEENRPNKQQMENYVDWVAVISAVESEVLLKIE